MNGLEFREDTHQYFYEGEEFISVTTLIKSYTRPFIVDDHAPRIAAREGVHVDVIKQRWKDKADAASVKGNAVHDYAERLAIHIADENSMIVREADTQCPWRRGVARFFFDHFAEIAGGEIETELQVCHPEFKVAGMVDLVVGNFEGVRSIVDYKTNERIEVDSFGDKCMYWPLNKWPDSNYWHYAMQLNVYARILRDVFDYDAQQRVLVHLDGRGGYTRYDMPDMSEYVEKLLKKGPRK